MKFFNTETISGLISILVGSFFYYLTLDFSEIETDILGASFLPRLYSVLLIIFGVILITKKIIKSDTDRKNQSGEFKGFIYGLSSMVIVFVYILILPYIGFYVATILIMLILLYFLKVRKVYILLSVSIGVALFVFVLFEKLLKVPISTGFLS